MNNNSTENNQSNKKKSVKGIIMGTIVPSLLIPAAIVAIVTIVAEMEVITVSQIICLALLMIVCIIFDVYIHQIASTDRMTHIANTDTFTMFAIRKYIFKKLHNYVAVFMNIRDLKYINRVGGSSVGDIVLTKYAQYVRHFLKFNEKVARLGGDNFIVLIRKERADEFLKYLDSAVIEVQTLHQDYSFDVRSRCGLYSMTEKDGVSDVFNKTSIALNMARSLGAGNYYWYSDKDGEATLRSKEVTFLFDKALENKEFKVYYQPKVDAETGKLVAAEALVRWERDGKILSPYFFISELENSGQIKKLDFYVLDKVCHDINRWESEGLRVVPVSSNFSKHHLNDEQFGDKVLTSIAATGIKKDLIEVEFTETVGVEDYDAFQGFLKRMNDVGIKVAIDDFGVGYSSLELLKNLNFSIIKIDKRFVDDIEANSGDNREAVLVRDIIRLCKDFDKQIVCEGVEKKEQKDLLLDMDCPIIQGYLYDMPLPAEEFRKRLASPVYDA